MISFLLKSSIVIALLLAFYKMILEKESFFSKNRMYLLGCLFLTFSLPFLTLPELVNNQGIVSTTIEKHIEKEPIVLSNTPVVENQISEQPISNQEIKKEESLSKNNNKITNTSESDSESITSSEIPTSPVTNTTSEKKGILFWLLMVYLFGVLIFSLNFISQIASVIFKIIKSDDRIEDTDCTIINSPRMTEPCSFFKYIFINPESYDYETYEQILAHERVHVKLNHTWDLILSEIVVIVMWFNPFAWILRKEIEKNIEYQTDDYLLSEEKVEKEVYQMNLLKVATYNHPLTVVTNYNQSLIKQRILRINAKKSNLHSYWKYAFIAPLLFGIALLLNRPNLVMAQSESISSTIKDTTTSNNNDATKISSESINKINQKGLTTDNNENHNNKITKTQTPINPNKDESPNNTRNITTTTTTTTHNDDSQLNKPTTIQAPPNDSNDSVACLALLDAIQAGDLNLIVKLLQTVDPNCVVKYSYKMEDNVTISGLQTPLTYAARNGNINIGELLIDADADVDYYIHSSESPVEIAIDNGNSNFVQLLIEHGAESNQVTTTITINDDNSKKNHSSSDALAFVKAAQNGELETVKYFIEEGVNINSVVPNMGTALSAAAQNGKLTTVKYLVSQGADLDIGIQNHGTALMRAAQNGKLKTVEYLISQDADIDYIIQNTGNALTRAAQNGELRTVKYLLSKNMDINISIKNVGTALIKAAQNGELATVKYLISQGAKIDFITENIGNALFVAAQNGALETVKYLHEQGADLNLVIPNRGTAMSAAAQNGELATLKYLRKHGKKN